MPLRALEESGAQEPERKPDAEHHRGLAPSQSLEVLPHGAELPLAQIARGPLDVLGQRLGEIGRLALTAALILILAGPVGMSPWLSALLVGVALAAVGYVMLQRGLRDLKRTDPTPRRTVESIKEDIQWAKEHRQ